MNTPIVITQQADADPGAETQSNPVTPSFKDASIAFAVVEPELSSVPDHELVPITADVPRAVAIGLGALPVLRSMRSAIVEKLPDHPIDKLDKLESYALAAWFAHLLSRPDASVESKVQPLLEEAVPLRNDLIAGAEALARFGFFGPGKVEDIRSGNGHLDIANDLVSLSNLFRSKWDEISTKTPITLAMVDRAAELATAMIYALGARLQPNGEPVTVPEAVERRARAFTLYVKAYNGCRAAVEYLRRDQGDAAELVPTIFGRPKTRRASGEPTPVEANGPSPPDAEAKVAA